METMDIQTFFSFSGIDTSLFDDLSPQSDCSSSNAAEAAVVPVATNADFTDFSAADDGTHRKVCLVCSSDAGKHSYYGGQVCNSCRAFFRRAIVSDSYRDFNCLDSRGQKDAAEGIRLCKIDSTSRKSCQYCRFQACVNLAGMQPKWIMSDSEVKVRREKKIILMKVKNEERKKRKSEIETAAVDCNPRDIFTSSDLDEIETLSRKTLHYAHLHLAKFYARHQSAHQDVLSAIYSGSNLSFSTLKSMDKCAHNIFAALLSSLPETKGLAVDDVRHLAVCNVPLVVSLVHATFASSVDASAARRKFLAAVFWGQGAKDDEEVKFVAGQIAAAAAASSSSSKLDKALSYSQMYASPWASSEDRERRHEAATLKIARWSPRETEGGPRDDVPIVLLIYIMLFSTEFLQLQSPKEAEAIQIRYMHMLHRYLKFKYPRRSLSIFVDGMLLISHAREAMEIRRKRLPV